VAERRHVAGGGRTWGAVTDIPATVVVLATNGFVGSNNESPFDGCSPVWCFGNAFEFLSTNIQASWTMCRFAGWDVRTLKALLVEVGAH
jgi:hypothetical protein